MYSTYYGSRQDGYGYNADMLREGFDLLEARADCLGWWSVARRVLRSYGHQPIIRLRRSSDSAEQDFYGIGPQGEVSTADVRAFNGWNLLRHTESFENAVWVRTAGVAVAQNTAIAPNGTLTADRISNLSLAGGDRLGQTLNWSGIGTFTGSIWLRAEGADIGKQITIQLKRGSGTGVFASNAVTLTGEWVRHSVQITTLADTVNVLFGFVTQGSNPADSVLAWGAQLERGTAVSPYEPRTTLGAGDSFLVTLYDQSGLARHFTQSTTTLQPIICEQGVPVTENGRLAAKFVAADARRMSIASSTAMFNALHTTGGTMLCVSRANDTAANKVLLGTRNASSQGGITLFRDSNENWSANVSRLDVAGVATTGFSVQATTSGHASSAVNVSAFHVDPDNATAASRIAIWQNGTDTAASNAQSGTPFVENANGNMTLGSDAAGGGAWDGPISEVALFSALISTTDRTTYQSRSGVFYTVTIA